MSKTPNPIHQWLRELLNLETPITPVVIGTQPLESLVSGHWEPFEQVFQTHDFQDSFEWPQVLLGYESWTWDALVNFHNFLRSKCCNIENYRLIIMGQPETSTWWSNWKKLFRQPSFEVIDCIDIPFGVDVLQPYAAFSLAGSAWTRQYWYDDFDTVTSEQIFQHRCLAINQHFNFFGGSRATSFEGYAKQYLTLQMSQYQQYGTVECLYDLADEQTLTNWVDAASHWTHHDKVENTRALLQQFQRPMINVMPTAVEQMKANTATQLSSFAQVVRESYLCQPFDCVSEKTFRAFLHQQLVIPTNYRSFSNLKSLGFEFPTALFNYSYCYEPDFFRRIEMLNHSLETFFTIPIEDLRRYFADTFQGLFLHNSELARRLVRLRA